MRTDETLRQYLGLSGYLAEALADHVQAGAQHNTRHADPVHVKITAEQLQCVQLLQTLKRQIGKAYRTVEELCKRGDTITATANDLEALYVRPDAELSP